MVKVLDQQRDRLPLAQALQESQHGLEHARFAPLGGGDLWPIRQQLQLGESRLDAGDQPGNGVTRGPDQGREHLIGEWREQVLQGGRDRRIWHAGRCRKSHTMDRGERLGQRGNPSPGLAQESA